MGRCLPLSSLMVRMMRCSGTRCFIGINAHSISNVSIALIGEQTTHFLNGLTRSLSLPYLKRFRLLQSFSGIPDVSYAGRISHPKRQKAVEMLRHASGIKFLGGVYAEAEDRQSKLLTGLPRLLIKLKGDPVVTVAQKGVKLSQSEYHTLLGRSTMALSIRGGGFDTLRYWEIVASGTLLLSEQPDIEIPNNFVHGKQALFFRPDLSDLVDLVRIYARDPQRCATMAAEGYKHLLQYHTCERRAEYFLGVCRGAI